MEGNIFASTETVECPLCSQSFQPSVINRHVNNCLNRNDSNSSTGSANQAKKRKSSEGPGTSPQKSAWGSLKPQKGTAAGPSSKKAKTSSPKKAQSKKNQNHNYAQRDDHSQDTENTPFVEKKQLKSNNIPVFGMVPRNEHSDSVSGSVPLAEKLRPLVLDDFVGQEKAVGKKSMLRNLMKSNDIPSMILWGPPGCGKTTLAKIIANSCKTKSKYKFTTMSATSAGVSDVKEAVKVAKNDQKNLGRRTILFLDEIHRFNKLQQDALLPHVEDGTIVLIGATTENPSFQVNSALLSRCKLIVLEKLEVSHIEKILKRACEHISAQIFRKDEEIEENDEVAAWIEKDAIKSLANLCDGDARCALNSLQMAIQSQQTEQGGMVVVTVDDIREVLQRAHVLYDRAGDEHYNIISALHKSIRGSSESAALYWLARMLEGGEDPRYIARRLIRIASEDIGLSDPQALNQAVSAYQACHFVGMPECDVNLAQCVVYLARAPKEVEVYQAYSKAKNSVVNHKGPLPSVPLHLRNASNKVLKSLGYGKGYKYNPDYEGPVEQEYFPPELKGTDFFS
ncbi:ATPase WRNIP1-like [Saccostrea echinata]|uniref:ATPase WRNIP1-like n=1 Tax=Saccostrea echinata TaxID=191078 RepID=UPI002A83636E|nr:ATPase WRNIP1-like [Saccostrea echinata]